MVKLGAISYCFKNVPKLEDVLGIYKDLGLSVIELAAVHADYARLDEEAARRAAAVIRAAGIECCAYATGGIRKDRGALEKLFAFARALGVGLVTGSVHKDALGEIDRVCGERGMRFAIENHRDSDFETPQSVADALRACSPRVGANIDTGHFAYMGHSSLAAVDLLRGRIYHVHLKDAKNGKMCLAGEGEVDLAGFISKMRAVGYDGVLSIEYEAGPASRAGVQRYKELCGPMLHQS